MVQLLFRFRRAWLAIILGGLIGALVGLRGLRFDFTSQYIFESSSEEYTTLLRLQEKLGRQDNTAVVLITAPDVLASEVLDYLAELESALAKVDGVQHVTGLVDARLTLPGTLPLPLKSLGSGDELRRVLADQPLLHGRIVSRDYRATMILVRIAEDRMRFRDMEPVVQGIDAVLAGRAPPPGVQARSTGVPVARVLIVQRMQRDQMTFTPICATIFTFLLYLLFRDPRATAVPLGAVLVSVTFIMGLLGAVGEKIDILNNIYPTLIFVIGLSDAIHLISRYRELLGQGWPQELALRQTVYHLAMACFLTSFTTAVGFASLGVADLEVLQRFGFWAAVGLMIAYVVTVALVPLVFSLLRPILSESMQATDRRIGRQFLRMSLWVQRHPRKILAGNALLMAACIWLGTRVEVTNNLYEAFNPSDPIVVTNSVVERHFAGVVPFAVVVEWPASTDPMDPKILRYLRQLEAYLATEKLCDGGISVADLIAEANRTMQLGKPGSRRIPDSPKTTRMLLGQIRAVLEQAGDTAPLDMLYNEKARMARIHIWTGDHGANVIGAMFERVSRRLAADAALQKQLGIRCYLSGDGPVASQGINQLIEDMFGSLLLAFVVIFAVMIALLRSLKTAAVSMIANIFPLLVTLGFIQLAGMHLRVTSVLVFTISLGLAVDDTIHFMARFREEWNRRPDYAKALNRTFRGTGRPILITTVVLGIGFGVLLTSQFPISRTFALCMEVTVVAALLGDLLLLPACLLLFRPMRPPAD